MYKVVQFSADDSLGIVNKDWLTPQKQRSLWPPYKSSTKHNKCLQGYIQPDDTWNSFSIKRLMFETDDLQVARMKCRKAESDSELTTADSQESPRKRKYRKRNTFFDDYDSSKSDESNVDIDFPSAPAPKKTSKATGDIITTRTETHEPDIDFPPAPAPKRTSKATGDIITTRTETHEPDQNFSSPKKSSGNADNQLQSDLRETAHNNSPYIEHTHTTNAKFLLPNFNVDTPFPSRSPSMVATPSKKLSTLEKINASLESIATYISEIKSEVRDLKTTQNDILLRVSSVTPLSKASLPDDIDLPLTSIEDINKIQVWLENEENTQNLINNLSLVGGNTTATITRRILQRLFSTALALQCNWTGKNNKFSLKQLRLTGVIINAVRRNKLSENAKDIEITNALTNWFRFAKDRDGAGGRENRRSFNAQQTRE